MSRTLTAAPVALTIAGSDSGGGAGIQADLRSFTHFGVHGCTAITALTAQNPMGVSAIQPAAPEILRAQLERVGEAFDLGAVKTGMLVNAALIGVVADWIADRTDRVPLVVDPVMVATSGARLIDADAESALLALTTRATLVTPNLPEAEALTGRPVRTPEAMRETASELRRITGAAAVLLKGGHLADMPSTDILCDSEGLWNVTAPTIERPTTTHGTGCTLASAIAANLALGRPLREAVRKAKAYLCGALAGARPAGQAAVFALPVTPADDGAVTIVRA